jgi:hypothetical protein
VDVEPLVANAARWSQVIGPTSTREGPSPPTVAASKSLLAFDFEDGILPSNFRDGHVVPCSGLSDSRFCALATRTWNAKNLISVGSRDRRSVTYDAEVDTDATLFRYSPTAVLAFDYRIENTTGLGLYLRNDDKDSNYQFFMSIKSKTLVYGAWAHAEVRLADFTPKVKGVPPLEAGDRIRVLSFSSRWVGDGPVYIDNIRVIDPEMPATTTLP